MNSVITAKILTLLVCYVGGPGTAKQSEPVLEKFMRTIEAATGWAKDSVQGVYRTRLSECQSYVDKNRPNAIVVDLPTYLKKHKAWKLEPLAHMGAATKKQYFVLVREGSYKTLAALKGKTLVTTLAKDARFISRAVFAKKLDAAKHFVLKRTRRALKGIRKVARGQADATLVDEAAFAHLKNLPLPKKLTAIFSSGKLPGLTLTLVSGTKAKLKKSLKKALPKICRGEGGKLCQTFSVSSFSPAKAALYRKLQKAYK